MNNYNNAQKKEAYDIYVTDVLRIISENTAKMASGNYSNGNYVKVRYIDVIEPQKEKIDEKRSAQEIVDDIVNRAGITVVKNDGCI